MESMLVDIITVLSFPLMDLARSGVRRLSSSPVRFDDPREPEQPRARLEVRFLENIGVDLEPEFVILDVEINRASVLRKPLELADGQDAHVIQLGENRADPVFLRSGNENHIAFLDVSGRAKILDHDFPSVDRLALHKLPELSGKRVLAKDADYNRRRFGRECRVGPLDELEEVIKVSRLEFLFQPVVMLRRPLANGAGGEENERDQGAEAPAMRNTLHPLCGGLCSHRGAAYA